MSMHRSRILPHLALGLASVCVLSFSLAGCGLDDSSEKAKPATTPTAKPDDKKTGKDAPPGVPTDLVKLYEGVDPRVKELLAALPVKKYDVEIPSEIEAMFPYPGLKSITTPLGLPLDPASNIVTTFTLNAAGLATAASEVSGSSEARELFKATYAADNTSLTRLETYSYEGTTKKVALTEFTLGKNPSGILGATYEKKTEADGTIEETTYTWSTKVDVKMSIKTTKEGKTTTQELAFKIASPLISMFVNDFTFDAGEGRSVTFANTYANGIWSGKTVKSSGTTTYPGEDGTAVTVKYSDNEVCTHAGKGVLDCTREVTVDGKVSSKRTEKIQLVLEVRKGEVANVEEYVLESKETEYDTTAATPTVDSEETETTTYDSAWRKSKFSNTRKYTETDLDGNATPKTSSKQSTFTYDEKGRLTKEERKSDGTDLGARTYAY